MSSSNHWLRSPALIVWHRRLVALGVSLSGVSAFSAMSGPGCLDRVVTLPGQGGSGGQGSTTQVGASVVTSGSGPAGPPTALALMTKELPADAEPCGNQKPCAPPADMLFIEVNSGPISCQIPLVKPSTNGSWETQIGLPSQYQMVGTHSLTDPTIYYSRGDFVVANGSAVTIGSGSPGGGFGTIEVISIDNKQIHAKVQGTGFANEDGDFVAMRCTPLP